MPNEENKSDYKLILPHNTLFWTNFKTQAFDISQGKK